jgi:hypothetical protein
VYGGKAAPTPVYMHAPSHVLVLASDSELSRSLRFALEVEGYEVTWRTSISSKPMPGEYDCTIVDHHAFGHDLAAAQRFVRAFFPVVLLANKPDPLSPLVFRTLLKPHLGAPLIDAVRDAIAQSHATK